MKKQIFAILLLSIISITCAQNRFDKVSIETSKVGDNVYMLKGAGGNVGVSIGEDGVFMIDDQFAPLSEKLSAAIKKLSDKPVTFLVNTHFHGDHSGGNANFENKGAMIVAHDNVRKRLAEGPKTAKAGLPIITFSDDATFYFNNNDIFITHVHNAHTDGDALIYFAQSNVLHTGDTFFNGMFPYIDIARGGSIDGDIEAAKAGLMLINDQTKIIPGHGSVSTKADYKKYHEMLVAIKAGVQKAIQAGKTEDEVAQMEGITAAFYTDVQAKDFFINGEKIRRTVFKSLTQK